MASKGARPIGVRIDRLFARHRGKLILLFWVALLFTLVMALMPKPPVLPGEPTDKIQHIMAFIALTILSTISNPWWRWTQRLILLSGFGAMIELLQAIPGLHRSADIVDWLADTAAIAITMGITALLHHLIDGDGAAEL